MEIIYNSKDDKERSELKKAYRNLKRNCEITLRSTSGSIAIEKYEIPENWFKVFPKQKGLELRVIRKQNNEGLLTLNKFPDSAFYRLENKNYKIYYKNPEK